MSQQRPSPPPKGVPRPGSAGADRPGKDDEGARVQPASDGVRPQTAAPIPAAATTVVPGRPADSRAAVGSLAVAPPVGTPVQRMRRLRLTVTRVDPWTVMRMAFLLSLAAAVITVVAIMLLWGLLAGAGVFSSVEGTVNDVVGSGSVAITQYFGFGRIFTFSLVVASVDVILITALATLGAFLYNLAASLVGGVEVSVTEEP